MNIKTYTKRDIASEMARRKGISTRKALVYIDEFFIVMRDYLCKDQPYVRIEIRNFGVFESKPTKAKPRARNPRTNEEIYVPPRKKVHYKPGKSIKKILNKARK